VVQWKDYNAKLESFNLIVKARNFLVFQGDVEAIAQKTPAQLTALFETISGSADLKPAYDELRKEKQQAEEALKMAQVCCLNRCLAGLCDVQFPSSLEVSVNVGEQWSSMGLTQFHVGECFLFAWVASA
jgi:hypothetical protein